MPRLALSLALSLTVVLGLAALAPGARAGTVNITYDLSGVVSVPGLFPLGAPGTGQMTLGFTQATGAPPSGTTVKHGFVHMVSFTFMQNLSVASVPSLIPAITGHVSANLAGSVSGVFWSGGLLGLGAHMGTVMGMAHCNATLASHCTGFPAYMPLSSPTPILQVVTVGPILATPGNATPSFLLPTFTLHGTGTASPFPGFNLGATFAGLSLTGMVTGQEVSRAYVPEPSTSVLALGGLGLVWLVRRARSRGVVGRAG